MAFEKIRSKITDLMSGEGEMNDNQPNEVNEQELISESSDNMNIDSNNENLEATDQEADDYDKAKDANKSEVNKGGLSNLKAKMGFKSKNDGNLNNTSSVPASLIRERADIRVDPEENTAEKIVSSTSDDKKSSKVNTIHDTVEGYQDVLSILGIKEKLDIEVDFDSDELDYVEFTQTTPLGFDFDEVTDFISRTKYTLHKLESAIKQRDMDVVIVASEVKKVEQKMIERNQEEELNKMLGGLTEEERLITDNMDLKVEVNTLKREQAELLGKLDKIEDLEEAVKHLEDENKQLRLTSISSKGSSLPLLANDEVNSDKEDKDPFFDMMDDIGGFYDE